MYYVPQLGFAGPAEPGASGGTITTGPITTGPQTFMYSAGPVL